MKKAITIITLIFCIGNLNKAHSQDYIYISEEGLVRFLRVGIGYTQWGIHDKDSLNKVAAGIYLANEVKIISGFFIPKGKFTIHDAFYFDMSMGALKNKHPLNEFGYPEMRFSVGFNFGYLCLPGIRTDKWAALAGVDFRAMGGFVGETAIKGSYMPLAVARGEYGFTKNNPDIRAMLMFWTSVSSKKPFYKNIRLELPLHGKGRWWLCGQYITQNEEIPDPSNANNVKKIMFGQWIVGIRVGNLP